MAVSKRLRYQVLRRDNFTCRYCGRFAPLVILEADHVIPRRHGGRNVLENLVTACEDCNSGKTDTLPDAWLADEVSQATQIWRGESGAQEESLYPLVDHGRAEFACELLGLIAPGTRDAILAWAQANGPWSDENEMHTMAVAAAWGQMARYATARGWVAGLWRGAASMTDSMTTRRQLRSWSMTSA